MTATNQHQRLATYYIIGTSTTCVACYFLARAYGLFGAAASLLVLFTLVQYFDSLQVTTGDALFLKTRHPLLVSQAVGHMIA